MRSQHVRHYGGIALSVAARSSMRHRVGCIIVDRNGFRYVTGFNRYLGDPEGSGWSLHAEAWAVLRAEDAGMRPRTAFVARHNGRLARPCQRCLAALKQAGVDTVFYSNGDGEWAEEAIDG